MEVMSRLRKGEWNLKEQVGNWGSLIATARGWVNSSPRDGLSSGDSELC